MEQTVRKIVNNVLGDCTCHKAYKDRGLIDHQCVWCDNGELLIEEILKVIQQLQQEIATLKLDAKRDTAYIKGLEGIIENWQQEMAYYTEEDIATPKGTAEFVGKLIEDNNRMMEQLKE